MTGRSRESFFAAACTALSEGEYRDACVLLRAEIEARPDDASLQALLHFASGCLARERGRADKAAGHFEAALRFDANLGAARRALENLRLS